MPPRAVKVTSIPTATRGVKRAGKISTACKKQLLPPHTPLLPTPPPRKHTNYIQSMRFEEPHAANPHVYDPEI